MWKNKLIKIGHWLGVWLFWPGVAVIAWGELAPHPPDVSSIVGWDKAQHFIAYFGLAGMATLALGLRRVLVWALLGIIALGGVLEILQGLTGRDADVFDFVANTLGALVGTMLGVFILLTLRTAKD